MIDSEYRVQITTMSKENFIKFFKKSSQDRRLNEKLKTISAPDQLVELGKTEGFDFSVKHIDDAIDDLKHKPGFFGGIVEAFIEIFSPNHDDEPPSIGVQPFSGEPYHDR
jgi:predicted ribosomally synthesized peptide with nif11-like leader